MEIPKQVKAPVKFSGFISELFHARIQIHIAHVQTKSYAQHIALDSFYNDIVGLTDGLIETWQGRYGIVTGYTLKNVQDNVNVIFYLTTLLDYINNSRLTLFSDDSDLHNQVDNIKTLINTTIYKLKYLQ